jgi:hypothetical protein
MTTKMLGVCVALVALAHGVSGQAAIYTIDTCAPVWKDRRCAVEHNCETAYRLSLHITSNCNAGQLDTHRTLTLLGSLFQPEQQICQPQNKFLRVGAIRAGVRWQAAPVRSALV